MRKHLVAASAILAFVLAACGSSSTAANPTSTCVNAGFTFHAWVVVQHLDGKSVQKCVGFAGASIDGKRLMDKSGVVYKTQTFSFGLGVCAVDNEPKTFSECFSKTGPYWSTWVESGGAWSMATKSFDALMFSDKDAIGFHYVPQSDPNPAPPPLAKES